MDNKEKNKDFLKNLAAISHEIQTPVNIIASTAKLIDYRKNLQKLDDESLELYVERIYNNCNKIAMLVSNIMEANLPSASKIEFVNPKQFFDTFTQSIKPYCKDCGVSLRCIYKTKKGNIFLPVITTERTLLNLVTNAIKYNDKENKKVTITMSDDGENIKFTVTDNGMGIHKKHLKLLTEEFYRVNPELSSGMGLGLTLVKNYVDGMNGTLKIESKPEKGTKITISVPVGYDDKNIDISENIYEYVPEKTNFSVEFSQFYSL